jgi:cob(I)alamin adenosyltransferase
MGKRLTTIATRTGDDGTTGLGDGTRTRKDTLRVTAMGDVDELNSSLGVLLTEALPDEVRSDLMDIQHDLVDLGGALHPGHDGGILRSAPGARLAITTPRCHARGIHPARWIAPRRNSAGQRTICRRAERAVALGAEEAVNPPRRYLNRLPICCSCWPAR